MILNYILTARSRALDSFILDNLNVSRCKRSLFRKLQKYILKLKGIKLEVHKTSDTRIEIWYLKRRGMIIAQRVYKLWDK